MADSPVANGSPSQGSTITAKGGSDQVTFDRSLTVGRHPFNGMVLSNPRISGRHAIVEWDAGGWRVVDLGSRNGTSVNRRRIHGTKALHEGDVICFGGVSTWSVDRLADPGQQATAIAIVENTASGRSAPMVNDRFLIGTGAPCDLVVPEWLDEPGPTIRAVLYRESSHLFLEPVGGDASPVDDDLPLQLGPTALRIRPRLAPTSLDPTEVASGRPKEYDLDLYLQFDGPGEGFVQVESGSGCWTVRTAQRFVLLYVLAQAGGDWVPDDTLKTKLWGRTQDAVSLRPAFNKLIHDTRRMFLAHDTDGWVLEKDRGRTRLRLPAQRMHIGTETAPIRGREFLES